MKKLLLLAFCISVLALYGCAVVDSHCYIDYDQVNNEDHGYVNTNGKAHMLEPIKIMTIFSTHAEEIIWFFDQKGSTSIKMFNYVNMEPYPGYYFHDDFYCNPDWNGCSWVSTVRACDYIDQYWPITPNWNCTDITYGYLFCAWDYEACGRDLPLADKLAVLNMGEFGEHNGEEGLYYNLNKTNFSITLENQIGQSWNVPITTDIPVWFSPKSHNLAMDRTNPLMANMMLWYADWLENYSTNGTNVTVSFNGISDTYTIAGWGNDHTGFSPDVYRQAAHKLY
jgi:hypothetical protein